eukprot:CAMPEP_0114253008 /NCGR_PEP_ID=MMETSP0058-20121206/16156_1 /TAXON_ID=36894 /ORGANISM="Pyramimonas parkeae, CCMP726" /LENGTH=183 /DNA_ID=CAMNT_0001367011 /DNA_START=261 /DNA_END=812 /DNA_ORIENTATION=+
MYRVNALLTLAGTSLAAICMLTSSTDLFQNTQLTADVQLAKVERMYRTENNDEALLGLSIKVDLNPLFTWNTKEVFLFVDVEYNTTKNDLNQVSIWDRIILHGMDPMINLSYVRSKYKLVDQGHNLRGQTVNLTLKWNTIPFTGAMRSDRVVFPNISLPSEYTRRTAGKNEFRQRFVEGDLLG